MAAKIIEVAFKAGRIGLFENTNQLEIDHGDMVIVEADKGEDIGKVVTMGNIPYFIPEEEPLKKVLRLATEAEIQKLEENRRLEEEALQICKEKVRNHRLNMNLVDAEYQLDHKRLTFYFTSDQRVDFRKLVRDLAARFKTRIELRQIGVRDAAKHVGGYGPCGCQLCCTTFLKKFESITIQYAKDQLLPMNASKLTGLCGRLKCCLAFERRFYLEEMARYPKVGETITTPDGTGKVEKIDIFNELVYVMYPDNEIRKVKLEEIVQAV